MSVRLVLAFGNCRYFALRTRAKLSNISNLKGVKIGDTTLSSLNGQAIFFDSILRFTDGHAWDWNKWAGLKYDSANKYVYLGIADGTVFSAN